MKDKKDKKKEIQEVSVKKSALYRFLDWVEVVGNKLPSPFTLFVVLMLATMFLSLVFSSVGTSVTYMRGVDGEMVETVVEVVNLFDGDVIRSLLADFTKVYINFAPLGLVLIMMMGIGLIEQTGLINSLMRKTLLGAPTMLVTAVLAFVGINANIASDVGMIFSSAIGGALFKALGRNSKMGIIVGFAASSGGFTANLMIAGTDALLAGISETVAINEGISAPINAAMNWYFMIAATFVLTAVTVFVAEKITAKSMAGEVIEVDEGELKKHQLTAEENRGLRFAGIASLLYIALLLFCTVPKGGFLRSAEGALIPSPFMSGIVAIIFFFFVISGIAYGIGSGVIKKESDVPQFMQQSVQGSAPFLVVALAAALFIEMFNKSGLTTIIAVNGANFLSSMNVGTVFLCIGFILLSGFVNLFTISGSAKWLLLAPIFIPMFSMLGVSPAVTQVAYRIGDSCTNIISPLSPYIPVILGIFDKYRREDEPQAGFGTIISYALPFTAAYLISLIILLIVWIALNLPLGPGAGIYL